MISLPSEYLILLKPGPTWEGNSNIIVFESNNGQVGYILSIVNLF